MQNKIYTIIAIGSLAIALIATKELTSLKKEYQDLEKTYTTYKIESRIITDELTNAVGQLAEELREAQSTIEQLRTIRATLTAYSPHDNIDGQQAQGNPNVTSIGKTPGKHIVAVDPARISYGTLIEIPGWGIVEAGDTGGALRNAKEIRIDLYHDTHQEAMAFGIQEREVKIIGTEKKMD